MSMESHIDSRRGTPAWDKVQETVVGVMKKTLGIMVFEAICPEYDFTDETIQRIQVNQELQQSHQRNQGIFETNMKEIRLSGSDCVGLYSLACLMEHSCTPNVRINFDKQFNVSLVFLLLPSFSLSRSASPLPGTSPKESTSPPCELSTSLDQSS